MKKAVIVVGKQNAGKSTTLRTFRKLVEPRNGLHVFTLKDKRGYIIFCSIEEYGYDPDDIAEDLSDGDYMYIVLACQGPQLANVHKALEKKSYKAYDVHVQQNATVKAKEILAILNN